MKLYWLLIAMSLPVMAIGCGERESSKGFSLPKGDPKQGEVTFIELQCHACHSVHGVELPKLDEQMQAKVVLGGEVAHLKTYGELVTSVINPSHRIAKGYSKDIVENDGQSKMKNYNELLTISQLINLVAFLEAHYELEEYEPTNYPLFP